MSPEELLSLARSGRWADRARAGRALSGHVGTQQVDATVRSLLLDPGDTAVIDATAEALLQRGDVTALRLFAYAWEQADGEQADHLSGVLSGLFFTLSCGSPSAVIAREFGDYLRLLANGVGPLETSGS